MLQVHSLSLLAKNSWAVSRQEHGDWFGIAVAGYPEAHPDVIVENEEDMKKNYWNDIHYLRSKVHAGHLPFSFFPLLRSIDTLPLK